MQLRFLLVLVTLNFVSTVTILSESKISSEIDGQLNIIRSATRPLKDMSKVAKRHPFGRSGVHGLRGMNLDPAPRSKSKRQSGFDPESFVSHAIGNGDSDGSDGLINSPGLNSGSTGTGIDNGNSHGSNINGQDSGISNTGSGQTSFGDTGSGSGDHGNSGTDNPGNGNEAPTDGGTPVASNTTSPSSIPTPSSGSCDSDPSPNGCAHEDGPSTGDPGWTCGSGGTSSTSNKKPRSRDLTSLRFHKRQNTPAYVQTMNTWRCKFCLPPLTYDSTLEQSAERQSNDAASQGAMVETPPNGQGTVMARGGGSDFETAVLFWICEVHTTNIDSCTCAKVYENGFQWTERGHYDFLVGKQAGQFGSIGCAYNDALGGLWTCALGMV